MTIERVLVGGKAVVRLVGRMDAETAGKLEPECDACIAEGHTRVVIDLTELSYISSMGLRSFVSIAKKLKDKSGHLSVCGANGLVRQVFEITRLTQFFPMHDTVESALLEA
jgi:anti-anti-sigma factor